MPYKSINLVNYKVSEKLRGILDLAQKEYESAIRGVEKNIITKDSLMNNNKKKISEKIFDFFFEPRY